MTHKIWYDEQERGWKGRTALHINIENKWNLILEYSLC